MELPSQLPGRSVLVRWKEVREQRRGLSQVGIVSKVISTSKFISTENLRFIAALASQLVDPDNPSRLPGMEDQAEYSISKDIS